MNADLIRPKNPSNPECPADAIKSVLEGSGAASARGARRVLLLGVGALSLATGVIGMFIPVLPTTCFLLLAAWCFARSSPRLHRWMHTNAWFGAYLTDYRAGRGIPRRIKIGSLSIMWATIGASIVFAISSIWFRLALLLIAAVVTAHVATLRDSRAIVPERGA